MDQPDTRKSLPTGTVRTQQGPVWGFLMHRIINPVMRLGLSGRFHSRIGSDTIMTLTFQGRRSGTTYSFPIGYMQEDDTLICYSPFGWWHNLRGGAPVTVLLRGQILHGVADVCTDTAEVAEGLAVYLRHNPGDAKFFHVALDENREPNLEYVARAAANNVQIRIKL